MLIKCQKCGFENQLGSIFCRGCGEKLDVSAMTPETLEAGKKKDKKKGGYAGTIICVLILVALGALAYFIFNADGIPEYQASTADGQAVMRRLERCKGMSLTPSEMTAFFNQAILAESNAESTGNFVVRHLLFTGKDDDLTIYVYSNLFTRPVVFTITGELEKGNGEKPVAFKLKSLHAGGLPIPVLQDQILAKFNEVLLCKPVTDAFQNAKKAEFDDGKLKFEFESTLLKKGTFKKKAK